jgi:hypothetical protein
METITLLRPVSHEGKLLLPSHAPARPPLRRRLRSEERGAVTVSGYFIPTWEDMLDTTQLAVDLDLETHKIALFTNSITPNFSTDTAYGVAPYNANELAATGNYVTGGFVLTGTTVTESPTGTLMLDATDWSVASSTFTNARCGLLYADALAGNNAIVLVNFGADYATSNGTFAITWAATGWGTFDITP